MSNHTYYICAFCFLITSYITVCFYKQQYHNPAISNNYGGIHIRLLKQLPVVYRYWKTMKWYLTLHRLLNHYALQFLHVKTTWFLSQTHLKC